ncbi:MAG: 2-isopropylmalate synthase [Candidatus Aminicenantales bacterium]
MIRDTEETRTLAIFDTTLRDGEQSPGCSLDAAEKLEIARRLERLGVDVIEAGFAAASPGDFEAVRSIAAEIRTCGVAALARARTEDIEAAAQALKGAARPRLHTFIATSPIHMQHKLKMPPEKVLEAAVRAVSLARNLCPEVEFSAEDATRSDFEFLARIVEAVLKAGAAVVNIPDTVGFTTPDEFGALIRELRGRVPGLDRATVSVHCHNDLGLAVANTLAAVRAGASQVEGTINGIGERAGNAALEEILMALRTRKDQYRVTYRADTREIMRTSRLVSALTGSYVPPNKSVVGANAFAHEAGIHQHGVMSERLTYEIMTPESVGLAENRLVLGKHSGRHAFEDRLRRLGLVLDAAELDRAFVRFKDLADKKKNVSDADLEALALNRTRVDSGYRLDRFIINSGNTIPATATIRLASGSDQMEDVASGDGPIDAAFKAIEKIVGRPFSLEDFRLSAVTEGEDAQGEAVLRLRSGAQIAGGRGLSTDIVEAGILAYLNAVNKMPAAPAAPGDRP